MMITISKMNVIIETFSLFLLYMCHPAPSLALIPTRAAVFSSLSYIPVCYSISAKVNDPIRPPEDIHSLLTQDDQSEVTITSHHARLGRTTPDNLDDTITTSIENEKHHSFKIKRLARNSDVFLLKGALTPNECEAIIGEAKENTTMVKALSDDSEINDESRYKCKVAKLDDESLGGFCGDIGDVAGGAFIKKEVGGAPDTKRSDLNVMHYAEGGQFVLHHDGKDRMLTVIYYLNGVAGTWFPLVDVSDHTINTSEDKIKCFEQAMDELIKGKLPGKDGLLISGDESICGGDQSNPHVVHVGRGDAIAFYSYQSLPTDSSESEFVGYRDWRAIHAGMPVQNTNNAGEEGKWIATHWYHAPSQMVDPEKELRERMTYLMNKFKVVSQ